MGGTDTKGGLTEGGWTLKGDVKIVGGDGHTKDYIQGMYRKTDRIITPLYIDIYILYINSI